MDVTKKLAYSFRRYCLPKKKLVILAGDSITHHTPYLSSQNEYVLAKAHANLTLKPKESHETLNWLEPRIYEVTEGLIYLVNTSPGLVQIKKSCNIADVRGT